MNPFVVVVMVGMYFTWVSPETQPTSKPSIRKSADGEKLPEYTDRVFSEKLPIIEDLLDSLPEDGFKRVYHVKRSNARLKRIISKFGNDANRLLPQSVKQEEKDNLDQIRESIKSTKESNTKGKYKRASLKTLRQNKKMIKKSSNSSAYTGNLSLDYTWFAVMEKDCDLAYFNLGDGRITSIALGYSYISTDEFYEKISKIKECLRKQDKNKRKVESARNDKLSDLQNAGISNLYFTDEKGEKSNIEVHWYVERVEGQNLLIDKYIQGWIFYELK